MNETASFRLSRVRPRGQSEASLPGMDMGIFLPTLLLVAFGVAMVFSASYPTVLESHNGDALYYAKRQGGFAVAGMLLLWLFSRLRLRHLRTAAYVGLIASIAFLIGVLMLGKMTNGVLRWFPLGPFNFQPSEMAKVALILALARLLADRPNLAANLKGFLFAVFLAVGVCGLVLMGKDFSTPAVMFAVCLVVFFLGGAQIKHLAALCLTALVPAVFFIANEPYRVKRLISFLNPEAHYESGGYHIVRSLIALGSGGPLGLGFSRSREKFFYLPTPYTDSIFAVIGEELGLAACMAVLLLFVWLGWRGMRIAAVSNDRFIALSSAGLTSLILIQALMNVMVTVSLMPPTGRPLPFISYGGSSLVFTLIAVGILANFSRRTSEGGGGSLPRSAIHGRRD
jgi:cell division protein FtsW